MYLIWLLLPFVSGFIARRVHLPPMVGFLLSGFILHAFGVTGIPSLNAIADMGVQLLLFGIGLKLTPKAFLRPEIWGTATLQMGGCVVVFTGIFMAMAAAGLPLLSELTFSNALLLAFAFSFSSTVFAVKAFEDREEMASLAARIAIGILIIQDIFAVIFLTVSSGKLPHLYSLFLLVSLPLFRLVLMKTLDHCGHGELVPLFGLSLCLLLGAGLFSFVGLKADLGALIMGFLVSTHPKADEISKAILSFKDVFLVGFFLHIGLSCVPTWSAFGIALFFTLLLPLKTLFYILPTLRFHLKPRTAMITGLSLANYSEFGLIVTTLAVRQEWVSPEWLAVMALCVTLSFLAASPLNNAAHAIADRSRPRLLRWQTHRFHPEEVPVATRNATTIILGMGQVGAGAYDYLTAHGASVLGIDFHPDCVDRNHRAGRNVIVGDATDCHFWLRVEERTEVEQFFLAMGDHANLEVTGLLRRTGYTGIIATTTKYEDQVAALLAAGANHAFHLFSDAGRGFAEHVLEAQAPQGPRA